MNDGPLEFEQKHTSNFCAIGAPAFLRKTLLSIG
jgi:hypothetical protein